VTRLDPVDQVAFAVLLFLAALFVAHWGLRIGRWWREAFTQTRKLAHQQHQHDAHGGPHVCTFCDAEWSGR
jgi:hypothetical protein